MKEPDWPNVHYSPINYQEISYYSELKSKPRLESLSEVDPENKSLGEALRHADGHITWERNFDRVLFGSGGYSSFTASRAKSNSFQNTRHNLSYVEEYVKKFSISFEDHRPDGAFWVLIHKGINSGVDQNLEAWGFKYKAGRGWWKK